MPRLSPEQIRRLQSDRARRADIRNSGRAGLINAGPGLRVGSLHPQLDSIRANPQAVRNVRVGNQTPGALPGQNFAGRASFFENVVRPTASANNRNFLESQLLGRRRRNFRR